MTDKTAIHALRINVKSLAAEAKFIHHEVRKVNDKFIKASLERHRVFELRPAARIAQLALAYIKGRSYNKVEPITKNPPDPSKLCAKLRRFIGSAINDNKVRQWLGVE